MPGRKELPRYYQSIFVSRKVTDWDFANGVLRDALAAPARLNTSGVVTGPTAWDGQLEWAALMVCSPGFGDESPDIGKRGLYTKTLRNWPEREAHFVRSWDLLDRLRRASNRANCDPEKALREAEAVRDEATEIGYSKLPLLDGRAVRGTLAKIRAVRLAAEGCNSKIGNN
jgi:hypothetical protein